MLALGDLRSGVGGVTLVQLVVRRWLAERDPAREERRVEHVEPRLAGEVPCSGHIGVLVLVDQAEVQIDLLLGECVQLRLAV